MHVTYRLGLLLALQGQGMDRVLAAHPQQQGFHVEPRGGATLLDGPLYVGDGMVLQQPQDTGVVLAAAAGTVLPLQGGAQLVE
jgi:hypothetical protein